ncbi:MAG: hypothetical protein S0880_03765 [Actinomycetota bacterium]|nr:hypothetical protein [Actinomycetota bacterium]
MTTSMEHTEASTRDGSASPSTGGPVVGIRRRTIDTVLIALGVVVAIVLAVAGGLLAWGAGFASDYVADELGSQQIFFPDAESLEGQGRDDLVEYAGEQVTTGEQAEAYASYIGGHLEGTADGMSYAEMSGPQRAAQAELTAAIDAGAPEDEIAELQATVDEMDAQRDTLFRGETLRGLLLSTYAWSTIGQIAQIASVVAFIAAAVMAVLVAAGFVHLRKAT